MADQQPARFFMRQAMCEFYDGSARALLDRFLFNEAYAGSPGATVQPSPRTIWSYMAPLVSSGRVELTGHLERSTAESVIKPGLLATSQPDFDKHTLLTDAGTFYGVMAAARTEDSPSGSASPVNSKAAKWMVENVTLPGQWKRAAAIKECMDNAGVTHREAEAAWNALGEDLKGTRGPKK